MLLISDLLHYRFGFDLDQHGRRDQAFHLNHSGCRTNLAEEFAMGTTHVFPIINIDHIGVEKSAISISNLRCGFSND